MGRTAFLLFNVVGMKTWSPDVDKVIKRQFLVCRIALLPVITPGKHEGVKVKAGEVRSDCGNLWNARSPRGGDPERLLLKDKHPLLTLYIQTTPYLIALICILSRDVS